MAEAVKRPDWVTCSLIGCVNVNKTWCNRTPEAFEFTFVDCSHAVLNKMNKGRLVLCPECCDKIIETFRQED